MSSASRLMSNDALERARQLYRHQQVAEAVELLERMTRRHPQDGQPWELLGVIHLLEGHTEQATAAMDRAAGLMPLSYGGRLALAECYRQCRYRRSRES